VPRMVPTSDDSSEDGLNLLYCARTGDVEGLCEILDGGTVSADFSNEDGNTALHYAAANGETEIVRVLICNYKAKALTNSYGNSPLHWAVQNHRHDVVNLLCTELRELRVLQKNDFGQSAVSEALQCPAETVVLDILASHHSAAEAIDDDGTEPECPNETTGATGKEDITF